MIRSQTTHSYHLDKNPANVETSFKVDQIITFDECPHAPRDNDLDTARLSVTRTFFTYDSREEIVRYISTNKIATLGGKRLKTISFYFLYFTLRSELIKMLLSI